MNHILGYMQVQITTYFDEVRWKWGNNFQAKALAKTCAPIPLRDLSTFVAEEPRKWKKDAHTQKEIDEECKKSWFSGTSVDPKIRWADLALSYRVSPRIGTAETKQGATH